MVNIRHKIQLSLHLLREKLMEVTAWNNSAYHISGAGYGLKVNASDRDRYFSRSWLTIILELQGQTDPIEVNVAKASFWNNTCENSSNKGIGIWLIDNGYATWKSGQPPKFQLEKVGEPTF